MYSGAKTIGAGKAAAAAAVEETSRPMATATDATDEAACEAKAEARGVSST